MSTVYVIMSNDFPAGVMSDETEADQLCEERNRKEQQLEEQRQLHRGRIYWRSYPFTLGERPKEFP